MSVAKFTGAAVAMGSAVGAIGLGVLANEARQAMDVVTAMENQMKLVTSSTLAMNKALEEAYRVAADTRARWEGTSDLYTRLARSTKDLGYNQEELIEITEAVNQSIAISGAKAEAAAAAIYQLGQGLQADSLQGEELRSVLEQTPRLARAIADGLGVTIAQLREMGENGELTAQKVVEAIRHEQSILRDEFSKTTMTMEQGWNRVGDASTRFFGTLDDSLGITESMATALKNVAAAVDAVTAAMKNSGGTSHENSIGKQVLDLRGQLKKLDTEMARRDEMGLPIGHLQARYSMVLGHVHQLESTYDRLLQLDQGMQDASGRAQQYMQQSGVAPLKPRPSSPSPAKQPDPNYLSNTALAQAYLNRVTDSWLAKDREAAAARERAAAQLRDMRLAQRSWSETAVDGMDAYVENMGSAADRMQSAWTGAFQGAENELARFVTTGKMQVEDLVSSMLADFARLAIQQSITAPLAGAMAGAMAGFFEPDFTLASAIHPHAAGGVRSGPGISAFSNSVVDQPTLFPFAKGASFGLMGEAGAEAIMPLRRTPSGNLGVEATGGNVTVNVVNHSSAQATARETKTPNGKRIDVMIEEVAARSIAGRGQVGRAIQTAFGAQYRGA
jgi:lambda family phage tail tape measure protein